MSLENLTISQIKQGFKEKKFSSSELVKYYLKRIKEHKSLNAFITVCEAEALKQAKIADQNLKNVKTARGLEGVPIAIKDLILTKGVKTTAGSKILENYIAPYDATVVKKLKEQGAIILGKNNCDEFAMGSSNENSAFGPVKNPWNQKFVAGGSSGGSAAAVAADLCAFSLGTDTGGSIRQPAAFCGVVGLKPTYGRVSRYGLTAMTSSLDQAGPLTKSVEDAAYILEIISGSDVYDASGSNRPTEAYAKKIRAEIKGLTLGVPKEYFMEGMDAEVEVSVKQAIEQFKKLGVKIKKVSLPLTKYSLAVYYVILPAEVSSNLARYDGIRYGWQDKVAKDLESVYQKTRAEGLGAEAKRRIIMGTFVLSQGYQEAYYKRALAVKKMISFEYKKVFKEVDALITPTAPSTAFRIGEKFDDPLLMYLSDIYTVSANIAGLSGVSVPAGLSKKGLPIGLQLLGGSFEESKILKLAYHFEQATDYHNQHPKNN